jgi:hypothetical protein
MAKSLMDIEYPSPYPSPVRNPSLLSFESDCSTAHTFSGSGDDFTVTFSSKIWGKSDSSTAHTSSDSDDHSTVSPSNTIWALTGRALKNFGEAVLRGATAVVIQARLRALKTQFPHLRREDSPTVAKSYRDMLELTRYASPDGFSHKVGMIVPNLFVGEAAIVLEYVNKLCVWPYSRSAAARYDFS